MFLNPPVRLVICDDHRIVIEGLERLLADAPEVECVGTATSGDDLFTLLKRIATDVLILDLNMPGMDGAEVMHRVRMLWPDMKVIILTMDDSPSMIRHLIAKGADGYLLKTCGREEFLDAVQAVWSGGKHISREAQMVLRDPDAQGTLESGRMARLSMRERQVLGALAEGLSNKEIGDRLFISHRTVDTHRTNLMKKLGVHNLAELVRIAIAEGLVH